MFWGAHILRCAMTELSHFGGTKPKPADFQLERELGHGAFAVVYLAKHRQNGTSYAIKRMEQAQLVRLRKAEVAYLGFSF